MFFYNESEEVYLTAPFNPTTTVSWPTIKLSDPTSLSSLANFGTSFDLSSDGTYIAVGATGHRTTDGNNDLNGGRAYVFERGVDSTWSNSFELQPPSPTSIHQKFGASVAISGDGNVIAVGQAGTVHVYEKTTGFQWVHFAELTISETEFGFGEEDITIDQSGKIIVISASKIHTFRRNSMGAQYTYYPQGEGSDFSPSVLRLSSDGTMLMAGNGYRTGYTDPSDPGSSSPVSAGGQVRNLNWNVVNQHWEDIKINNKFLEIASGSEVTIPYMYGDESSGLYGNSVGIGNSIIVVGEVYRTLGGHSQPGGVKDNAGGITIIRDLGEVKYVTYYVGNSGSGTYDATRYVSTEISKTEMELVYPWSADDDRLGTGLDVSDDGNYIYVSVPGKAKIAIIQYEQPSGNYYFMGGLTPGNVGGDGFGARVRCSRDGSIVVTGQPQKDNPGVDSGMLHIYIRNT